MKLDIKINKKTRIKDVAALLTEDRIEELLKLVPAKMPKKPIKSIRVRTLAKMLEPNYYLTFFRGKYLYPALCKLKGYRLQMEGFDRYIKAHSLKKTREEEAAAMGVPFPPFIVSMCADLVDNYHLKSIRRAEWKRVYEWMIYFEKEFANNIYSRRLDELKKNDN